MSRLSASLMPDFDPIAEARRNWSAHWGDEPVPSMSAVTSIMRVQQILLARLNDELKPFDLTFPRYEALMLLYYSRRGALPLGKMGDRLQVHRTSVTNIIDGLERSGFVTAAGAGDGLEVRGLGDHVRLQAVQHLGRGRRGLAAARA